MVPRRSPPTSRRSGFALGLLWWLFCLASVCRPVTGEDRVCSVAEPNDGWQCSSGECIPRPWLCDGEAQCPYPDQSDEKEGCQLFPDSECQSWGGRRHTPCPDHPERCVEDLVDCQGAESHCPGDESDRRWRCLNGQCIPRSTLCDGTANCRDKSDEEAGCRLYLNETNCFSWSGIRHVPCRTTNGTGPLICTLSRFADTNCRECPEPDQWRCNNGLCIQQDLLQDGYVNCQDGSDENLDSIKWWTFLIITGAFGLSGIGLSFSYRFLKDKKHIFDCGFCRSARGTRPTNSFEMVDKGSQARAVDACDLPFDLIYILDNPKHWRGEVLDQEREAQALYARVHQSPKVYKNLYHFLVHRHASPQRLGQVMSTLLKWERDFHDGSTLHVASCWRLHLGASEILSSVVAATQPPGLCNPCFDWYLPVKNSFRQCRQDLPEGLRNGAERAYNVFSTFYYMIKPFLGAIFFYFDLLKDMVITSLLFFTLNDLARDSTLRSFPFESFVVFVMFSAIIVSIGLSVYVSCSYSDEIFELCDHKHTARRILIFRVLSSVFTMLMPPFILANHVYYLQQEYAQERELQDPDLTLAAKPPSKSASISNIAQTQADPPLHSAPAENAEIKAKISNHFQKLEHLRYKNHLHRRIYSCYRIIFASVQSFAVMVGMILIILVDAKPSRRSNNVLGAFAQRLRDFFHVAQTDDSWLVDLDIVRDVVLGGSIMYSFVIIITALHRFVYQCKSNYIGCAGKLLLLLYFSCHICARVTLFLGMTVTAQNSGNLIPVTIIATCLYIFHGLVIFYFKWRVVPAFKNARAVEKLIHVLANTLVAIPFMEWNVEVVRQDAASSTTLYRRSQSFPAARPPPAKPSAGARAQNMDGITSLCQMITAPLVKEVGDLNQTIINMWWDNPRRNLTLDMIMNELPSTLKETMSEQVVEDSLKYLSENGYLNIPLHNPKRTKTEYFWLLSFHFILNIISFCVEIWNGGTPIQSGTYYSWDLRLCTFSFGIIFLLMYYRRYHILPELNLGGWCDCEQYWKVVFCCAQGEPLKASVREEKMRYYLHASSNDDLDHDTRNPSNGEASQQFLHMSTQTSVVEEAPKSILNGSRLFPKEQPKDRPEVPSGLTSKPTSV